VSCDPGQTAVVVTVAFGCSRKLIVRRADQG